MMNYSKEKADSYKILVVDDMVDNLKLLNNILTHHGYQVRPATSGKLALKSVAVDLPDLILLDINMPEMNGYEVCMQLKVDERSQKIPVIFISAQDDNVDKIKGFNAGAVDFITVPFQREEVLVRVKTHLALYLLQRQLETQNLQLQHEIIIRKRMVEDITDPKRMNQEMARLDRLNFVGEMAASIGHEIRNPMTTVRGYLQMVKSHEGHFGEEGMIDLLIEELDRANSVITEFISLAKHKFIDPKLNNINSIVAAIQPLVNANALARNMNVRIKLEKVSDIFLDEKEIRQLLLNLSQNGLEAMSPGGTLFISTYMENNEVILSVTDEGHGISPEILDRIGNPFMTTKENGIGLGLSVCYGIANRHRAKIDIKTGNNGTTMSVHFPL